MDNCFSFFKDTEVLLEKLEKDQEAVEQVRQIVENEEAIMKRETEIVQNYADVRALKIITFLRSSMSDSKISIV